MVDPALLKHRFRLRETHHLCERFAKSPNLTERCTLSGCLLISYAPRDKPVLPLIEEAFLKAYRYARGWFDYRGDMPFDLWMAPEVADLHYMTCQPHSAGFFCAPGTRDGRHVILFVSPSACPVNGDNERLGGLFAHEISHHLIEEIAHATPYTMRRREVRDLPMWLEEGLCQFVDGEVYPPIKRRRAERLAGITSWYGWEELWNDLSSCHDVEKAYLQAYNAANALVEAKGRLGVIRLLYSNRTRQVSWPLEAVALSVMAGHARASEDRSSSRV
jgi:hypothetical protein